MLTLYPSLVIAFFSFSTLACNSAKFNGKKSTSSRLADLKPIPSIGQNPTTDNQPSAVTTPAVDPSQPAAPVEVVATGSNEGPTDPDLIVVSDPLAIPGAPITNTLPVNNGGNVIDGGNVATPNVTCDNIRVLCPIGIQACSPGDGDCSNQNIDSPLQNNPSQY